MHYNSSSNDVKRQREYDMNKETMNIEDMDFTPEDLQNAGVDVGENTEDTETPTPDEPSTTDAGSDDTTDESEQTPNTNEELAEDEHKHDGNLKAALAQERARRKAAEERARQFEQQQKPLTLPDSEISDIREFVRREALKRFNLKAEDLESLMYEDVNKYNDFIRFEANAEYAITNKQMAAHQQRQTNMNFVNEDGLYNCVLDSRKPNARKFRKWITSEVLPSIRKHGMYATEELINNPRIINALK